MDYFEKSIVVLVTAKLSPVFKLSFKIYKNLYNGLTYIGKKCHYTTTIISYSDLHALDIIQFKKFLEPQLNSTYPPIITRRIILKKYFLIVF